jgi:iron complex outermembrane recepter protein
MGRYDQIRRCDSTIKSCVKLRWIVEIQRGLSMKMRYQLAASAVALSICSFSTAAFAQSTGSVEFEEEIIVTGSLGPQNVQGIQAPDSTKAKAVLTKELIERQNPGQTILDTINVVPGVSFQNNDAYGSSGGTLTIRGFDASRISLTIDGIPLNDSGNYAIFSNQQLDPELIDQVNVNLGTTDVDSPTASAVGGTVNYRTIVPTEEFGVKLSGSIGEYNFMRIFALVNTGNLTSFGTRAWFSLSRTTNDNPFNNYGVVDKKQYNARIYQPLSGDDFISVTGNLNVNRNNFFGSLPLRQDLLQGPGTTTPTAPRIVGSLAANRFPRNNNEREYLINYPCLNTVTPVAGTAQAATTCGNEFDRRYNPSNTGNIRGSSRFSFGDKVVLTVDPSYQYVKANGGGTVSAREARRDINPAGATAGSLNTANCTTVQTGVGVNCQPGYWGGAPYFGRDLNGDGDILDQVLVVAPSQTQTHRIGVIANLRYEINDLNSIRLSYTYDRARHRQTGQVGLLDLNGEPFDVFPVNDPQADVGGTILQKRDRLSYAILHQIAGEYRGEFMDEKLVVNAGLRAPFFRRNLTNYCFASSSSGFVECSGQNAAVDAAAQAANPYSATTNAAGSLIVTGWALPQNRVFNYNKVLPNVGALYHFTPEASLFASFAQGLSVPGTDSLYNAFYFPLTTAQAKPSPETTDSFDIGVRYRSGKIQAQAGAFLTKFQNRLATAYDPELDQNVYRNLGSVDKRGFDGSVAVQPIPEIAFYFFGSYIKTKIKDDVIVGECTAIIPGCASIGAPIIAPTAGKEESGAPRWSYGATVRATLGPVDFGFSGKKTGTRFVYDSNLPVFAGPAGTPAAPNRTYQVFGAKAPAYWLVNLDARINLEFLGLNDKTFLQLNVYNLMDNFYQGGFSGGVSQAVSGGNWTIPNVQIGAPRTVSASFTMGF